LPDSARKKLEASRKKAQELKEIAQDFISARKEIPTGEKMRGEIENRKRLVMEILGASDADWESWHWQMQNRIGSVETLDKILDLNESNRRDIEIVGRKYRWAFAPYYATLMNPDNPDCPIRRQMIPQVEEMDEIGVPDFSGEEYTSPVKALTRWYPDRVIIRSTNI